jgi:hypothetical protein
MTDEEKRQFSALSGTELALGTGAITGEEQAKNR